MNKVILMGRLVKDPEVRYSQSGEPIAVARYTLAVNRRFRKEGEQEADFINCVAFRKNGEFAERFLKKGMQILITGSLQVRSWDDQQGQRHWSTEVVVEEQQFTESKASFESRQGASPQGYPSQGYSAPSYQGQGYPSSGYPAQGNPNQGYSNPNPYPSQTQSFGPPPQALPPAPENDSFLAISDNIDDDDLPF